MYVGKQRIGWIHLHHRCFTHTQAMVNYYGTMFLNAIGTYFAIKRNVPLRWWLIVTRSITILQT